MSRIVLAMSGGVDSSVAAHLLREAGHDVVGVFMRHGERSPVACATENGEGNAGSALQIVSGRLDHKQGCCSASDAEDARRVADKLDIPFYALDLAEEFERIIDYFVDEYTHARTPNPCVVCNNWIKFGKLFDYAESIGAQYVATGHYARLIETDDGPALLRGVDDAKDQSYVLFGVQRERLAQMMLPVGGFRKLAIRQMAGELGLRVADKPDSQEICFVTSGKHHELVGERRGETDTSGTIVTTAGDVVGQHDGIERFTIGQRKGLGVALGEPRFVVRIELESHCVVIGTKDELARDWLTASGVNWLVDPPTAPLRCRAQIRYNAAPVEAQLESLGDAPPDQDRIRLDFDEPCFGVAPGQAVVFYDGQRVLGGGWIE